MKKHLRVIIWTLGLGVLLFAVFILLVNLYVQSAGVQNRIRRELSWAIGLPVGVFRTTFSPWGGFRLDQISIPSETKNAPDFLQADYLEVRCELWPLLRGRTVLKRIALDTPHFVFQKNSQDQYRLPKGAPAATPPPEPEPLSINLAGGMEAIRPPAARTPPPATPPPAPAEPVEKFAWPMAAIRKLLLRDGTFRFLAQDGRELFRMEQVRFSLTSQTSAQDFAGTLEIKRAVILDRWPISDVKSTVTLEHGILRVPKLAGDLAGGRVEARAEANLLAAGQPYSLHARLNKGELGQFFSADSDVAGTAQGLVAAQLDYDGNSLQTERNRGHAELKISRAAISRLPILQMAGQLVRSNELAGVTINKTTLRGEISGPDVTITPSLLESEHVNLAISGKIDAGQTLDLQAQLQMKESLFKKLPKEATENFVHHPELDRETLDFVINGTLAEPHTNLVSRLVGEKLERKLRNFLGTSEEPSETPPASPKK